MPLAPQKLSLGNTASIASPSPRSPGKRRRYKLQDYAARLLPNERVAHCMRSVTPGAPGVEVMYSPDTGTAYLRNTMTCNDLWKCPVCAEKITTRRREELSECIAAARARGWLPVLVTITLRHAKTDDLATVLDGLLGGWRAFTSGKTFQALKTEWTWEGSVKSLETTYGINGWHPHLHLLVFTSARPGVLNVGGFKAAIVDRWRKVLARKGFDASWEHGVDVRAADDDIAEYVAKFGREPKDAGWTASDEMARSGSKRGRAESLTPFQLLDIYGKGDESDEAMQAAALVHTACAAGALFCEYARVFTGRNQLVWSRGLRDDLGLSDSISDEEAAVQETAEAVCMVLIETSSWLRVLAAGKRGELLDLAASGDAILLRAWLWNTFKITRFDLKELAR